MAPPRMKLHKTTGKLKTIPKPGTNQPARTATDDPSPTNPAQSESDRQFEMELYWCIQQLESSLCLPQVRENSKKVEDTTKLLTTLKSATQPIIRKRQIMRTTFGDYRSKMAAEEQSLSVDPESVRFEELKEKTRYHYLKKSAILSGEKNFRFNFTADGGNDTGDEVLEQESSAPRTAIGTVKIAPSDNSFRFNFSPNND
ncbi:UPF0488 protein CG14286 [Anopheles bellator]|uniref:UPF0488 protein CG14286 n=1 Tax=Anopheles bellator TaxID=139047 RepID=UPI002647F052|nr:UPF0488 protein CG14286 [Anopheles bellator]